MKLKQFFENLLKWFDEISPLMIGLLFSTIPMLIHSFYALYINEKKSIPDFLRMSSSALAAIGIEFLVFLYALKGKTNNMFVAWGFFSCQIILNLLYYLGGETNLLSSANGIRIFLAIVVPSAIMAYSHLITKSKEEKQEKSNLVTIVENTQVIAEQVQEVKKKINRFPKRTKKEIAMNIPKNKIRAYRSGKYTPVLNVEGKVEDSKPKTKIIV